jgi:elongation factor G
MNQFDIETRKIRTCAISAHVDAGKTTLTERILYYTGRIHKMGEVHDGETQMDSDVRERERGITIHSAATTVYWKPENGETHRLNLIDTPGHIDFTAEVERSLRVLDGTICVLDGAQGVEPQTEQVWRQADKYNVSRLIFVNKMDKVGANHSMCLESIKKKLGVKYVPIQIPIGEGADHEGIIDLVSMREMTFSGSNGRDVSISKIKDVNLLLATKAREDMLEILSDIDDEICEKFLDGRLSDITEKQIINALRIGTINKSIFPVLCGSAFKNKGVQPLLDAVVRYLPAPSDLPAIQGVSPRNGEVVSRHLRDDEPFAGLAFKIVADKNGSLTFVRVYSGVLRAGSYIHNATRNKSERAARLLLIHADSKEIIEEAKAGTIVGIYGLKHTYTGDTLCTESNPILLEKMTFAPPVVEVAVFPKSRIDQDKMSIALQRLALEDPSLRLSSDEETGQTVMKGMGELHLDIVADKLRRDHGVEVKVGKPSVSYRETITSEGFSDYKHVHQSGGRGQYGHVVMNIKPAERGQGLIFKSEIQGGAIPKEYLPAIEKGIIGAMDRGVIADYPLVDIEVTITDGSYHAVDSSSNAFEIAGSKGFQQAVKNANPVLLEPIMSVEVVSPDQYMGTIIGIISSRAGQIRGSELVNNSRIVQADVPLRTLFGFTTELRGSTQGRAVPSMQFSHYEICNLSVETIKKG